MKGKVIIIAEAGVNHNGDLNIAKKLIDVAALAKVDYVKFQTFKAEKIVSPNAKKADYQSKNIGDNVNSQFNMLKQLELSGKDHTELISYCNSKKIKFFSTAFDVDSVDYLDSLNLDVFKIPSGEITNYPYLKRIAQKNKSVILSTGMSSMEEIESAIDVLVKYGLHKSDITVLHCNTEYPTPMEDVNLKAMSSIGKQLNVKTGYSDHTLGIEVAIAAVALGASVIEKHFTLDRTLPGPDHRASLEPNELKSMVSAIRNIEDAISGNGEKIPSKSEIKNILIVRKSIHINRDIIKGSIITDDDIIALRPGNGISPMEWNEVVGKTLLKDKKVSDQLKWEDVL